MGVYHISGLGTSPGALTMPLTAVYILQIAQALSDERAEKFFEYSGELGGKGSYEKTKGLPEVVIAFTSREVIEGNVEIRYNSRWFNMSGKGTERIEKPIGKYFKKLFKYIKTEFNVGFKKFDFYLVEVNHQNFEDCFRKVGVTLKALIGKEVWANMIGGSNQINASILTAGAYTATVARYYYLFQTVVGLLEPEWIEKPNRRNLTCLVGNILSKWYELPIFNLEIGGILRKIGEIFGDREKVNVEEFRRKLIDFMRRQNYVGKVDEQFFAKLRGKVVIPKGDVVEKGPIFDRMFKIWNEIDKTEVKTFSDWKKWAKDEGILHEVDIWSL